MITEKLFLELKNNAMGRGDDDEATHKKALAGEDVSFHIVLSRVLGCLGHLGEEEGGDGGPVLTEGLVVVFFWHRGGCRRRGRNRVNGSLRFRLRRLLDDAVEFEVVAGKKISKRIEALGLITTERSSRSADDEDDCAIGVFEQVGEVTPVFFVLHKRHQRRRRDGVVRHRDLFDGGAGGGGVEVGRGEEEKPSEEFAGHVVVVVFFFFCFFVFFFCFFFYLFILKMVLVLNNSSD